MVFADLEPGGGKLQGDDYCFVVAGRVTVDALILRALLGFRYFALRLHNSMCDAELRCDNTFESGDRLPFFRFERRLIKLT